MKEEARRIVDSLEEAASAALSSHEHSDGDSLGALLGLAQVLRDRGKTVLPALPDDAAVPPQYRFLPGRDLLVPMSALPEAPDLFVAMDCGNLDRLAGLKAKASASRVLVNIDHHEDNTCFGRLNLVEPYASSSSEIVFGILHQAGWEISPQAATCFYTGLLTDTGRFRHQNTSARSLRTAADLVDLGVAPEEVVTHIYEKVSLPYLRLSGLVMERARMHDSFPLAYSYLTQDDLAGLGVRMGETEDLIDQLRVVGEARAVLLMKEQSDGLVRASLRSRDEISVGEVARV
jgi:phosphoesterase RecJ-like protein